MGNLIFILFFADTHESSFNQVSLYIHHPHIFKRTWLGHFEKGQVTFSWFSWVQIIYMHYC